MADFKRMAVTRAPFYRRVSNRYDQDVSRWTYPPAFILVALLSAGGLYAAGESPEFQAAVAAGQRGDWPAAERNARAELKQHPTEAEALSLLGVALDNQNKLAEAEENHKLAVANAPGSSAVLNNYGNHLLLARDPARAPEAARDIFLKAVAVDPADNYAWLQLAQLAVMSNQGREALKYLEHLPAQQLEAPNVAVFKLAALDQTGNRTEAEALFNQLAAATENNASLSATLGRVLAQTGQFDQAETFLTHALAPDPANFSLLYQLGVVASRAGHNARAQEVLEKALRQQPQNVDVIYSLAFVYTTRKQPEAAVRLLAQASRLAPQRADVQKLLAVAAGDMRAFDDSVAAWDRYVTLAPNDDTGRRERGFARAHIKQPTGLADLEWYVARHPDDPTGLWELGVAQAVDDPEKGLASLDKAIARQPDFVEARSARGSLNYQQGNADAALADLEFAASRQPDNPLVLDRLGQTYLLLDRTADALRVLRKAAELAPDDAKMQLHVANALGSAGQTEESRKFMQRYKELGGGANVIARGVMDYLSLTPEQQHADYRARVEKGVKERPDDVATLVLYLKLSIADGRMDDVSTAAGKIAADKPGAILLTDAGRALLAAKQYKLAKQMLEQAEAAGATDLNLELAIAGFQTDGLAAGLQRLDRVPASDRGGDYYLAKAQMLDASGKPQEAIAAIELGVKAEPARPDLYWQAAVLMMANQRAADALQLLDQAAKAMPQEAQVPVIRAAILELAGKTADARQLLNDTQHRWPEVAAVWVAQGIIAAAHEQADAARKILETAVALGGHSAELYYALAQTSLRAGPEHIDAAESAIEQALKLVPDDVQAKTLGGRIAAIRSAAARSMPPESRDEMVNPAKLFLVKPPQDW
jgi:tetratricopeptide (TPR) repeat protein